MDHGPWTLDVAVGLSCSAPAEAPDEVHGPGSRVQVHGGPGSMVPAEGPGEVQGPEARGHGAGGGAG